MFNTKLTRRDFVQLAAGSTAALSLGALKLPEFEKMFAEALKEIPVIWLQGAGCNGCTISTLNVVSPTIQDLLLTSVVPGTHVSMQYHPTIMAAQGDLAMSTITDTVAKGPFVLVLEGSVPLKDNGIYAEVGEENGEGITILEHVLNLAPKALAVVAAGTCAAFGGITAAAPNPTGAQPLEEILKDHNITTPVVNLPGCPPHPDWVVGTLATILMSGLDALDLDKMGRPKAYYGKLLHDQCPRRGHYEKGLFATKLSEPYCLFLVGCKGPVTYADCSDRLWNNKTRWCVEADSPCIGCAHPGFPDAVSPMFEAPPVINSTDKLAIGIAGTAVVLTAGVAAVELAKKAKRNAAKKG